MKLLTGNYMASITVTGKTVILDGAGATLMAQPNLYPIDVGAGASAHVVGLSIVDTNPNQPMGGSGVHCTPSAAASVELDHVSIDTQNTGVFTSGCTLKMSRSTVLVRTLDDFHAGIVSAGDTTVDRSLFNGGSGIISLITAHVTNSVFVNTTGPQGAFFGTSILGPPAGSIDVSFSTIVNSAVPCSTNIPTCSQAAATGAGSCIDNSVFFDDAAGAPVNTLGGAGCVANYSLIFPQATTPSGAHNTIGINPQLKDPANGDYHLTAGSPAVDAADPAAIGTPDFDGTARPQGTRSDMGAFELKQ